MHVRLCPASLPLALLVFVALVPAVTQALWPNIPPLTDQCTGTPSTKQCKKKLNHTCVWSNAQAPDCFEATWLAQTPSANVTTDVNLALKFFAFSYGVHLSEGTNQQWWFVDSVDECAGQCLSSVKNVLQGGGGGGVRCLSFDFYPIESPQAQAPYLETVNSGICVLNTENKDTARLRNEDMGLTDAELLYTSHFTYRPFSALDGYYELRNPRGGELNLMLDFSGSAQFATNNLWPMSRWGILHLVVPQPKSTATQCGSVHNTEPDTGPIMPGGTEITSAGAVGAASGDDVFEGVFTPVDLKQHCPGWMSKPNAVALCSQTGAGLCSTSALKLAAANKLGCGIDTFPIWDAASTPKPNELRFVRCCVQYTVVPTCQMYQQSQLDYCSTFKTASECVLGASGSALQSTLGFGNLMARLRAQCASTQKCRGLLKDWVVRDSCLWCLAPGQQSEGGDGTCRAGNDFGICPTSLDDIAKLWALKITSQCDVQTICRLGKTYQDRATYLGAVTPSPTPKPTAKPTAKPTTKPSARPSRSPTMRPSLRPSASPVSQTPSAAPTAKPSRRPTEQPTARPTDQPTARPTDQPTARPTRQPSKQPTSEPTNQPSVPKGGVGSSPTALPSALPTPAPITGSPTSNPGTRSPLSSRALRQ